jgi:hypothetical protein
MYYVNVVVIADQCTSAVSCLMTLGIAVNQLTTFLSVLHPKLRIRSDQNFLNDNSERIAVYGF